MWCEDMSSARGEQKRREHVASARGESAWQAPMRCRESARRAPDAREARDNVACVRATSACDEQAYVARALGERARQDCVA